MCRRSPFAPKYSKSVSGRTLASAKMMASPSRQLRNSRNSRRIPYCSCGSELGPLRCDHEWHGIHAEAGYTELEPEAHDFQDLCLDFRVTSIQVWLKIIKAVEVPQFRNIVAGPGGFLDARKNDAIFAVFRPFLRPDVPVPVFGLRDRGVPHETKACWSDV